MEPPSFEDVCAMDFQPRSPQRLRASRDRSKARSMGYDSLQSLKTTVQQSLDGYRSSRDDVKYASARSTWVARSSQGAQRRPPKSRSSAGLDGTLQASNPHMKQTAILLRSTAAESSLQREEAFHVLDDVIDDSISALQNIEARYRKALEQKRLGAISAKSLDQERAEATEVTRLSQEGISADDANLISLLHDTYKKSPNALAIKDPAPPDRQHPEVKQIKERISMLQKPVPREELMVPDLPWLRTVAPYMRKEGDDIVLQPEILRKAPAKLKLDYVYSYTGEYGHRNMRSLHTGELLYSAGAVCVVLDVESRNQRLFCGHTDLVLSIAVLPMESGGLVASGQIGDDPVVCLWNANTMQELARLQGTSPDPRSLMLPRSVVSMCFSPNGRLLAAVGDDDGCTIAVHRNQAVGDLVYSWEASEVLDVRSGGEGRILCLEFNPYAQVLVTCGDKHMKFWEFNEKEQLVGTDSMMGCESQEETFLCLAFVDAETTITGLESGMIWIWKGLRVMKTISNAHKGPVFDICVDGYTAISGGEDMKLCLWNFAKDYRLVPPGEFTRGEMLVKEIEISKALCHCKGAPAWLEQLGVGSIRSVSWKGHRVAVGTAHNHLLVVDENLGTGRLIFAGHHRGGLTGLVVHQKLPWMITTGAEGAVLVWNLVGREVVLARNFERQRAVRKKPDMPHGKGKGREEEEEEVEEEERGAPWKKKRTVDWPVGMTCIDISADGKLIAVGQDDGGFFVQTLEYHEGRELALKDKFAVLPFTPQRAVSQVRFSPDLDSIAVGLETGVVRLYALSDLIHAEPKFQVCRGIQASVRQMDWDEASVVIRCNDDRSQLTYIDARDCTLLQRRMPVKAVRGGDREVRESPWASLSCPLCWQTHGLYLGDHNSGDVRAVARCPSQALFAAGDVYGQVVLGRNPCLSEEAGLDRRGGHGEEVCFLGFTRRSDAVLSAGRQAASLFQWSLISDTPSPVVHKAEPDREGAQERVKSTRQTDAAAKLKVCGVHPPAWSHDFGWTDGSEELLRIIMRQPPTAAVQERATTDPFPEPWRLSSVPPRGIDVVEERNTAEGCEFEPELRRVVGYSGSEHRGNVVSLLSGETVYPAGAICVLCSADGDQRFFRGHSDAVTSLAVHPNGGVVASGDGGKESSVLVWDSGGGAWTGRTLYTADSYLRGIHTGGVVALSFSGDGAHLLSVGSDAEHTLMVHRWEDETPLLVSKVSGGSQRVLAACFNPYSHDVISCGVGHVKFWSLTSKGLLALDSGVSDEFLEWAVTQEACCSTHKEAVELGQTLVERTNTSAAFLDEETAVTGSVDGRVYLWKRRYLQSAEKGHGGPVFDVDSARGRGLFRGTLVITMEGARKEVLSLLSQGARSEDVRQRLADAAMQRWFEEETRVRVREPRVKSALVSWSAAEDGGMVSCGGREVKVWVWELELCVGFRGLALAEGFERYSTVGRGRHKWRARSMSLDEFLRFLRGAGLLFDPKQPHHKTSDGPREGPSHPMVSAAEATDVFASADMDEIGMEEFVQMVGQVAAAVAVKERGNTPHGHKREKLEMDMVDLQGHLSDLERQSIGGSEDFSHRILHVREEIKAIALQLKAMRVFVRRVLRAQESLAVGHVAGKQIKDAGQGSAIALFHCHDRRVLVGTASDEVYEIQLDSSRSTRLANGQDGVPIVAVCAVSSTCLALSEALGGKVRLWDVQSGDTVFSGRFRSTVICMDVWPARSVMALGLEDGSVHVVQVAEGLPALCAVRVGQAGAGSVTCVRFSPDGSLIAAGMVDASVHLLRVEQDDKGQDALSLLKEIAQCRGHAGKVTAMDWSDTGRVLRSESRDGKDLLFWASDSGKSVAPHTLGNIGWSSSTCIYAWGARALHRHVAAADPEVNKSIAPVVGHRIRLRADQSRSRLSLALDGTTAPTGRVIDVAEGGWFMVAWEGGEPSIPEGACSLEYPGEELLAVTGSEGLVVGCGSAGSVLLVEPEERAPGVHHCSAHSGPVRGVALLEGGSTIVTVGARDRTLLQWTCKRRHRKSHGLYVDLERVLRVGARGTAAALLAELEDFAARYFGLDSNPSPAAEIKAMHFRLVRLFRIIGGAAPLHRTLLPIAKPAPTPPPPQFVGRSPIQRRSVESLTRPRSSREKTAHAAASRQTPAARKEHGAAHLRAQDSSTQHPHAAKMDREARFARFRASVFLPVGHGRTEGPPKIWHLRFGPLHVEGGVLKVREAKAIFAALDRDGRGRLSHSDFISGLRKFPRLASRLDLPTTIRQGDGSMDVYLRAFGEIDTDSSKTIDLEKFLTYFCRDRSEEIVRAKVYQIENRPWSYSNDVIALPPNASKPMMITGREPRRRRVRERSNGPAVAVGPVSLSDADMEELLGVLGFSRSDTITYQAFINASLASPAATALLRSKGVRPEQCAALYCFRFKSGEQWVKWRPEDLQVALYRPSWELSWIHRRKLSAREAWVIFKRLDPSHAGLQFQSLRVGQRAAITFETFVAGLDAFPDIAETLSLHKVLLLDRPEAELRIFRLMFGEKEPVVDMGREMHMEWFVATFSDQDLPPPEGTLLLPSIDNLEHSRRFNLTQKEARNIFRQLAACKSAAQDRSVLRHADFLHGLRTFPAIATLLGLPERIGPSGGALARYQILVGQIFQNKRAITEDDFAQYFNPHGRVQAWKQHVVVRMITDGEEDQHKTPPPSPRRRENVNAHVGTHEFDNDPEIFPEKANLEVKPGMSRTWEQLSAVLSSIHNAVGIALAVLDLVRSPLVDMGVDMEERIAMTLSRLALLCVCASPLRKSDVELAGNLAATQVRKRDSLH